MTLNDYLRETGETYSDVAGRAGLSPSAVRLLALGKRHPRPATAHAIASATKGRVPVTVWYEQAARGEAA